MQAANDRPFAEDRLGQLSSHREIVLSHQTELARCSYLLTSNLPKANQLAVSTLLDFFARRDPNQPPEQQRVDILTTLARQYLHEDDEDDVDPQPAPIPFSPPIDQPQRYQVDDERTKLLGVLDRLDPVNRVALILRDYAHLDDEHVARALDLPPYQLAERLPPIRQRLRDVVSVRDDVSIRSLLDQAAGATPRPQLWPLVAEPLAKQVQAQRERGKQITWAAAAGVAVLLLIGGIWLFSGFGWLTGGDGSGDQAAAFGTASASATEILPTSTPANTPTPLPPMSSLSIPQGSVPSSVILTAGRTGVEGLATFLLDPDTDELTALTDEQSQIVHQAISPDGRRLARMVGTISDGSPSFTLQVTDTQTDELLWAKESTSFGGMIEDFAFTSRQLYVITRGDTTSQITALDPETGQVSTGHFGIVEDLWDADRLPPVGRLRLLPTPAGNQLWVSIMAAMISSPTSDTPPTWTWVLASYSLPDLTLQASQEFRTEARIDRLPAAYNLNDKLFTPDGKFLVTRDANAQQLYFYSPFEEKRLVLNLRFTRLPGGQPDDLVFVPSNSGRYLYVFAMSRYEFAIVDLLARTVPRLATLDTGGLPPWPVDQDASMLMGPRGMLSSDGTKLYLATNWPEIDQPEAARINVIDVATWTIVDQWAVAGTVINFIPLDGGSELLISHMLPSGGSPSILPVSGFSIFDTTSGEPVVEDRMMTDFDYPERINPTRIGVDSLYNLYQRSYGRSPSIDGQQSVDAEVVSSLPRVRISTPSIDTNRNRPFTVSINVADPSTGAPLLEPVDGVRFDPESIVTLTLSYPTGDASDVLLVMQRNEDGVFQALANLPEPGFWDAQLTFTPAQGQAWSMRIPAAVNVRDTVQGTDGRTYHPSIVIQPEEPHANTPFTVLLRWYDVETRHLIPEGVELEGGTPQVTAQFFNPENGIVNVPLQPTEHGVFEGTGQLSAGGRWHLIVSVQFPGADQPVTVDGGSIFFPS